MMPPSNFGARVDSHRVALGDVADLLDVMINQHPQYGAAIIGRAANQKITSDLAPAFLQPFNIGLEAAGGRDQCGCANGARARRFFDGRR